MQEIQYHAAAGPGIQASRAITEQYNGCDVIGVLAPSPCVARWTLPFLLAGSSQQELAFNRRRDGQGHGPSHGIVAVTAWQPGDAPAWPASGTVKPRLCTWAQPEYVRRSYNRARPCESESGPNAQAAESRHSKNETARSY
jgi:hypothetical protein